MDPFGGALDVLVAGFHLVVDIFGLLVVGLLFVLSMTDIPSVIEEIIGIILQ